MTKRYRVYFKGSFAGVVLAANAKDAKEIVPTLCEVREDTSNR